MLVCRYRRSTTRSLLRELNLWALDRQLERSSINLRLLDSVLESEIIYRQNVVNRLVLNSKSIHFELTISSQIILIMSVLLNLIADEALVMTLVAIVRSKTTVVCSNARCADGRQIVGFHGFENNFSARFMLPNTSCIWFSGAVHLRSVVLAPRRWQGRETSVVFQSNRWCHWTSSRSVLEFHYFCHIYKRLDLI